MTRSKLLLSAIAALLASATSVYAEDRTAELDARHETCLERIAQDQQLALEEAMIWRDQGGARRARHCEAMALFALGHEGEAAHRLDQLADGRDGGSPEMRVSFRSEAANFWLAAMEGDRALASATAGLEIEPDHVPLRISSARAHALNDDFDNAADALNTVITAYPDHAEALRYRADVRMRQDRMLAAKEDIEASLSADPTSGKVARR